MDARGPIRVRAVYSGPWSGAFKLGYGFWHIQWIHHNPDGDQLGIPLNVGTSCVHPLDVWVPVPDDAIAYRLFPTPDGVSAGDTIPIPPETHPDGKKPPSRPLTEPA
jgi:hypothetical protein